METIGPVSDTSHDEPVAAESFGDATQLEGRNPEPSSWLLELGTAARTGELRSEPQDGLGHPMRAWSSRRAAARARREFVQQAIAAAIIGSDPAHADVEPGEPAGWHDTIELPVIVVDAAAAVEAEQARVKVVALPPVQADEPEPGVEPGLDEDAREFALEECPATALLARIRAYTGSYDPAPISAR